MSIMQAQRSRAAFRRKLGRAVLGLVCICCLSLDGYSDSNPNLISGGTQGTNGVQLQLSLRTFQLAGDPMAGVNFAACEQVAAMQAALPDPSVIQSQMYGNPLTNATAGMSGILAGALGAGIGAASNGTNAGSAIGNGMLQGGMGGIGSYNPNNGCPELKKPVEIPGSCPKVGDNYNFGELDNIQQTLVQSQGIAVCREALAKRTTQTLDCFQTEFNNLKDALNQVKNDFDTQINAMDGYTAAVQAKVQTEKRKQEMLKSKIGTLTDTASEVDALYKQITGAMQGSPGKPDGGTITGLKIQTTQIKTLEARREKNIQLAAPHRAFECFTKAGAASSKIHMCSDAAGNLLSPEECLFAAFGQDALQQRSGNIRTAQGVDRGVVAKQKSIIQQRLNQLLSDFQGGTPRTMTVEAWISRHQTELNNSLYWGGIGPEIINELRACASDVSDQMTTEESDPNSDFYQDAQAVAAARQTLMSTATDMINKLDTTTRNALRELTGNEVGSGLQTAGCTNISTTSNATSNSPGVVAFQDNTPDNALLCAQGLAANLNSMLTGQGAPGGATGQTNFGLNVIGQSGVMATCASLRDCIQTAKKLEGQSETLVQNMAGNGTFSDTSCTGGVCPGMQKFVRDQTNSIRSAIQQTASVFSARVAIAKAEFARVKGLLGLSNNKNLVFPGGDSKPQTTSLDELCPAVPPGSAKVSADDAPPQLCHMGNNFGEKLAGLSGLPNIQDGSFDGMKSASNDMNKEAASNLDDTQAKIRSLASFRAGCEQTKLQGLEAKNVQKIRNEFDKRLQRCKISAGRSNLKQVQDFGDRLEELSSNLARICSSQSTTSGDCSTLQDSMLISADDCQATYDDRLNSKNQAYTACLMQKGQVDAMNRAAAASGGNPIMMPDCQVPGSRVMPAGQKDVSGGG